MLQRLTRRRSVPLQSLLDYRRMKSFEGWDRHGDNLNSRQHHDNALTWICRDHLSFNESARQPSKIKHHLACVIQTNIQEVVRSISAATRHSLGHRARVPKPDDSSWRSQEGA